MLFVTIPLYMKDYGRDTQLGAGGVISLSFSHLQTELWKIHPYYSTAQHHSSLLPLPTPISHRAETPKPAKEPGFIVRNSHSACMLTDSAHVQLGAEGGEWV